MGRTARGVRGIRLAEGQKVISLIIPKEKARVLTASEKGYGKQTKVEDFPLRGRGGQGVIAQQCSERNGQLVGAIQVVDGDEMMLISDQGTLVRTRVSEVSQSGRNTQGVRLIRLKDNEKLVGVEQVAETEEEETVDAIDESTVDVSSEQAAVNPAPEADSGDAPAGDAGENQDD
jgi:DNA gyrase subunit A